MKKRFAKAAIALSLAATMTLTSVPMNVFPVYAEGNNGDVVLDLPEVYPQSAIENISDQEVQDKVNALLKSMTKEEMYNMLGGADKLTSPRKYGTGYLPGVPRLGVPILRMWDGPKGVIGNYVLETTSPSSEVSLAASFDEQMAYDYGKLTGTDNTASAGNVQLGSQLDLIRGPFFRRSRDSMSEDAYLTSKLGYQISKAIKDQHVIAMLKHMACYSETSSGRQKDVKVDEQTLHEMYLAPYEYIIKHDGATAVMSSYNAVNGINACSNEYLLKTVLRDMWGFKGMVASDWRGNYEFTTGKGMDLEMPYIVSNNKENIEAAIAAGTMTWDDVKTAVGHILTAYGQAGYLGLVQILEDGSAAEDPNPPAAIELPELTGEAKEKLSEENGQIALDSALEGSVLLKNDNNALPLAKDSSVAVIGLLGDNYLNHISESSYGMLRNMTGPYTELKKILGDKADVSYATGLAEEGQPVDAQYLYTDEACTKNGVSVEITTDGTTKSSTMDTVRLTTGTIDGEENRTYKNGKDGNALVNGQKAVMTTYLKVPVTGSYELQVAKIAGKAEITINNGTEDIKISGSGTTGSSSGNAGIVGASAWPSTGVVPTHTGMDLPKTNTTIELEAGKVYKITVDAEAMIDEKDLQLSLNWFRPGDRDQLYNDAVELAKTKKQIVFVAYDKGETRSTGSMDLEEKQLNLLHDVLKAAKANGNKVTVVLQAALPVTMDWLDDADAVLQMWLAGEYGGKAAAQLLTGEVNPSGKLPMSWPKSINDTQYGDFATGYTEENQNNLDYYNGGEGIFSGYRWYDKSGIDPLYEFGYGLSYTTFDYSDLEVTKLDDGYDVSFTITNTGDVEGSESAQVYLGAAKVPDGVQMADYKLAAFARVNDLKPGESKKVTTKIEARELSYWDVNSTEKEKWTVAEGERTIYVGSSHDNLLLNQKVDVKDISLDSTIKKDDDKKDDDTKDALTAEIEALKKAQEDLKKAQEEEKAALEALKKAQEEEKAALEALKKAQADAAADAEAAKKEAAEAKAAAEAAKKVAEEAKKAAEEAKKAYNDAAQKQTTITTAKAKYTVKVGKKVSIRAKATNKNGSKITYRSGNKKIATVSSKGVIRGRKKGSTKITIKCNGVKKTVQVKVK